MSFTLSFVIVSHAPPFLTQRRTTMRMLTATMRRKQMNPRHPRRLKKRYPLKWKSSIPSPLQQQPQRPSLSMYFFHSYLKVVDLSPFTIMSNTITVEKVATTTQTRLDWSNTYEEILAMEDSYEKFHKLGQLSRDFNQAASRYGMITGKIATRKKKAKWMSLTSNCC